MRKIVVIGAIILVGFSATWYFDLWNEPVETIEELIGQNYDYAHKKYFEADPDGHYTININDNLNEFDGGIWDNKEVLIDSIVHVYTWNFMNHKKTIWVGETEKLQDQVIDAVRYKNDVQY